MSALQYMHDNLLEVIDFAVRCTQNGTREA